MRIRGLLILLAGLLLNLLCASAVSAYSVSTDSATNDYTVGGNEIEINEVFETPYWFDDGDEIQKEVTVTNTGRSACAVRLFVRPNDMEILEHISIDFNRIHWADDGTGYYYYKGILAPGETTEPLFTKVNIQSAAGALFQLYVYGESRAANW